jgi:hypothetical protein
VGRAAPCLPESRPVTSHRPVPRLTNASLFASLYASSIALARVECSDYALFSLLRQMETIRPRLQHNNTVIVHAISSLGRLPNATVREERQKDKLQDA